MNSINYIKGDATLPINGGIKIIVHICNNIGAWGSGFVVSLSNKWKLPEEQYKLWNTEEYFIPSSNVQSYDGGIYNCSFFLGNVQFVKVEDDIWVANMIAQCNDIITEDNVLVDYTALKECLYKVNIFSDNIKDSTIHMPRIGCGIGRGKWEIVENIIHNSLINKKITVYDF